MKDIRDLVGTKYPIFQGAMAQISYYPLVAAVAEAGGLGIIASGGLTAEQLRDQIKEVKARTNKPFGVNLMLMKDNTQHVEVLIEEGVKVVTTGAGTPKPYMKRLKEAGVVVIPVVPSAKLALKMQELGADAVVAEGTEAGGHVGEACSLPLWQAVIKAVDIPVIAAGGIADGKGVAAAFALGAKGVQMGTVFLATEECPVAKEFKEVVLKADELSTVVTGRKAGGPVRSIANSMTRVYLELEERNATRDEFEKIAGGSLRKAVLEGNTEEGSVMAGQIVCLVNEIKKVKDVIEDTMAEAKAVTIEIK